MAGFAQPAGPLDFGNSGTGCRLVMGAVAGCPITAVFDGDASLRKRPMKRVLDPARIDGRARPARPTEGGRLPLTLQGARDPIPIEYAPPVASAQFKSAVLLAGLAAPGETTVIEKEATRDHTEKMLTHFGAEIVSANDRQPWPPDHADRPARAARRRCRVPADPSSAAFPARGGADRAGLRDRAVEGVMTNPLRTGLFMTLREMGADDRDAVVASDGGEEVADLRVRAVAAARRRGAAGARALDDRRISDPCGRGCRSREGTTRHARPEELRVKESDRLAATADMLRVNGVEVEIEGDDLIVQGSGRARAAAWSRPTWITASRCRRW